MFTLILLVVHGFSKQKQNPNAALSYTFSSFHNRGQEEAMGNHYWFKFPI
jgi:hypothetical protein